MYLSKRIKKCLERKEKSELSIIPHPSATTKNDLKLLLMNKSENHMMFEELEEKICEVRKHFPCSPPESFPYGESYGNDELRISVANFMLEFVLDCTSGIDKDDIFVHDGATSVLEMMSFSFCDENDYLVIPNPFFGGFNGYFKDRFPTKLLDAPMDFDKESVYFSLNFDVIREAVKKDGVKGIVFCNPNNPLGESYSEEDIRKLIDLCLELNVQLVSDEVYANCCLNDDQGEKYEFISAYKIVLNEKDEQKKAKMENLVHVVYSLSKDFGLNGFRFGVLLTKNEDLKTTFKTIGFHQTTSRDTMYFAQHFLKENHWISEFFDKSREKLNKRFQTVRTFVDTQAPIVRYVKPKSGCYLWINFTFISTWDQEHQFYELLLNDKRVAINEGSIYHALEPGWYRIIITSLSEEEVMEGIKRIFDGALEMIKKIGVEVERKNRKVNLTIKNIDLEKAVKILEILNQ